MVSLTKDLFNNLNFNLFLIRTKLSNIIKIKLDLFLNLI